LDLPFFIAYQSLKKTKTKMTKRVRLMLAVRSNMAAQIVENNTTWDSLQVHAQVKHIEAITARIAAATPPPVVIPEAPKIKQLTLDL
jgi:hypothetical protein